MIKVDRPARAPDVLRLQGAKKRRALCAAYTRSPARYTSGTERFAFDSELYGHDDVKSALRAAQHGKCAFCESQVTHIAYGDIEHFHPKGGFRPGRRHPLEFPGYYWLAYEWSNLLFACQLCNQRHKKNEFPLLDETKRARSHRHALADEEPLFVDPSAEDPALSISFRQEVPFPRNKRGRETIRALGLRRSELSEVRRDYFTALQAVFVLAYVLGPDDAARLASDVADARRLLQRAATDEGQYAAMVRAAIPRWERKYKVKAV
jgi:uncharacterized protein (TIGR02646 family)